MGLASNLSSVFRTSTITLSLVGGLAFSSGCESLPAEEPTETVELAVNGGLAAKIQLLSDRQDIRSVIDCYGMGHDLIFNHLGGDHSDALNVLRRCNTDDLVTNVYLFDETKPAARLDSLSAFVGFVEGFALQQGYSSARNVPGNVHIEFTGPSSAKVWSSTVAPHFLTNGAPAATDRPTVDIVSARYVDTVVRGDDDTWRTVERDLIVQQIWRGEGAYPFASP
jgi:SnoaL-like domain